jgi:hypothetical protein
MTTNIEELTDVRQEAEGKVSSDTDDRNQLVQFYPQRDMAMDCAVPCAICAVVYLRRW